MYVIEILGQLIIIYRCWVLWSKNYWVIIVPCLGPLATIGKSALMTLAATQRSLIT
jgi:hypothetical protein